MSPKNDQEYAASIQVLLREIKEWMHPMSLPLSQDNQIRFIQTVFARAHEILNSEPHLRGAVIAGLNDMRDLDVEKAQREASAYRAMAINLRDVLAEVPTARLGLVVKSRVKLALAQASKL